MIGYVYHLIHVRTPHEHHAKLFVTDVPDEVTSEDLQNRLEGFYSFGEFNIPWANHVVGVGLKHAPTDVQRAWRNGEIETIEYAKLCEEVPN